MMLMMMMMMMMIYDMICGIQHDFLLESLWQYVRLYCGYTVAIPIRTSIYSGAG